MAGVVFWEAGEGTFHLCSPWMLSFRLLLAERSFWFYTHNAAPSFPSEFRPNFFNLLMDSPLFWCIGNEIPGLISARDLSLISGIVAFPALYPVPLEFFK